jgi:hypothetical protein
MKRSSRPWEGRIPTTGSPGNNRFQESSQADQQDLMARPSVSSSVEGVGGLTYAFRQSHTRSEAVSLPSDLIDSHSPAYVVVSVHPGHT